MSSTFGAVDLAHGFISRCVKTGDICIDATAGRGNDTEFLCGLVGETGKVYSFDIQEDAVKSTRELLEKNGHSGIAEVILDGHENVDKYVGGNVACAVFNFGWLPSGDHTIFTQKSTSIIALEKCAELLKDGGIMSLSIYYGRNNGFEEKEAILDFAKSLDFKKYTVIVCDFANRPNCSPIGVLICKGERFN